MLHLICGDSGAGKTALCTDLVKAALKDGKKVFYNDVVKEVEGRD